jgi:hypothetical protein
VGVRRRAKDFLREIRKPKIGFNPGEQSVFRGTKKISKKRLNEPREVVGGAAARISDGG